jgi:pimeloyl-ACP methyl ester carboxylesterase
VSERIAATRATGAQPGKRFPTRTGESPASLLLVHGAGSGPWIFDGWIESFPGLAIATVDLHEGVNVNTASHTDYAETVRLAAAVLPAPVALCGWSMGGLVVLQASLDLQPPPHSAILLEPSPPAEVQGFDPSVEVFDGTFDPEAVYGPFPPGMRARPESSKARAERKYGISVPTLSWPSLVIYGDSFRDERGPSIAKLYHSHQLDFPGLDHWDLVRDKRVRTAIARWLGVFPTPRMAS